MNVRKGGSGLRLLSPASLRLGGREKLVEQLWLVRRKTEVKFAICFIALKEPEPQKSHLLGKGSTGGLGAKVRPRGLLRRSPLACQAPVAVGVMGRRQQVEGVRVLSLWP